MFIINKVKYSILKTIIVYAVIFFSGIIRLYALNGETPSTNTPKVSFGAGAALWGYDTNYIMELNAELKFLMPLKKSVLNFNLTLPMFMALVYEKDASQNEVFKGFHGYFRGFHTSDYGNTVWPEIVSPAQYLVTYLKMVSWETDTVLLSISPETPEIHYDLQNMVWYNPFFDRNTGILNRYIKFKYKSQYSEGGLYSSSLTSPSLFFAYYRILPFATTSDELFHDWSVTPSLWSDLEVLNNPDWGGGLETSSGGIGNRFLKLKFLADGHIFSSRYITAEGVSYRFDAGSSLQFIPFGFYVGYIHKSIHHPFGPFLSPLYVSRQQADYQSYAQNHGVLFRFLPGIDSLITFGLDTEIYPENPMTISIKGQIRVKWKESSFDLAYIHEDITGIKDFMDNRADNTSFIELHLQYYLLPHTFLIEWRHVVSFSDHSSIKTLVSLMAYF